MLLQSVALMAVALMLRQVQKAATRRSLIWVGTALMINMQADLTAGNREMLARLVHLVLHLMLMVMVSIGLKVV